MLTLAKAVIEHGFVENLGTDEVDCLHCGTTAGDHKKLSHADGCPVKLAQDVLLLEGDYATRKGCRYRSHRGSLAESMETIKILSDKAQLVEQLIRFFGPSVKEGVITLDTTKIEPYCFDDRIGWDTHIVTVDMIGPVGFTDGPVD